MSVKHIRREYETRLSMNTRSQTRNANGTTETNFDSLIRDKGFKNQKKKRRHSSITVTEHTQENSLNENNCRNNVKRIKRSDDLCSPKCTSYVNRSNEAIHSPFTSRGKKENVRKVQPTVEPDVNSCTQKLVDVQTSKKVSKSLSSVKVHFVGPLKLSRLRKPTMRSNLPIMSRENDESFENNSSRIKSRLSDVNVNAQHSLSTHYTAMQFTVTSPIKNKRRSTVSSSMKQGLRFSKSPKIVLKFSKSKPLSKKQVLSKPEKRKSVKCSPNKCNDNAMKLNRTKDFASGKYCDASRKNGPDINTRNAMDLVSSMTLSSTRNRSTLKEPIVVLQRLSIGVSSLSLSSLSVKAHNDSISNRLRGTSKFSDKSYVKTNNKKISKRCPEISSRLQRIGTAKVVDAKGTSLKPLMSSTPMNGNWYDKKNNKRKTTRASGMCDTPLELTERNAINVRRENKKGMKNKEQEVKKKNETYELAEPETPTLRKKLKKDQRVWDANCDEKEQIENSDNAKTKKKVKSPIDTFRGQRNSVSNEIVTSTAVKSLIPDSQLRNRSKLITNSSTKVSRPSFERSPIKKPSLKYSAAKKIPNFLKIHERIFAKSESIVDAKRRLEEKHTTLTTPVNKLTRARMKLKEKSKLPNESSNNLHNRFGFKIRKNDATNYILRKTNLHSIRNKVSQQQQTRTILKGVRTNRRFELQMKARNINL
ncbi:uncharacterized protein LOC143179878 [Calliopsis andreniformis]|uniref:uncharacterized protein LOC143179878 n=1 Tax=Calliopsis andreniformis TaxID=337506 RepID=UPI003FCDF7BB